MTIDTTKITPEKLAEMNTSLMVDNNYLRGRIKELEGNKTKLRDSLVLPDIYFSCQVRGKLPKLPEPRTPGVPGAWIMVQQKLTPEHVQ